MTTVSRACALELYVIYYHPLDYPTDFVIRRFEGETPTGEVRTAKTLDAVRAMVPDGCVNIGRMSGDEPQIVEVWV
jgi:hypothetical protein